MWSSSGCSWSRPSSSPPAALRRGRARAEYDDVGVVQLDLVDTTRSTPEIGDQPGTRWRELPTTVYLPPARTDRNPLILLAHGFNGHPRKFTDLARHWAEAGYVVAVPRFPVSSDEFPVIDPAEFNARIADLPGQAGDVIFVIDEVVAASNDEASDSPDASIPNGWVVRDCRSAPSRCGRRPSRSGFAESGVDALIQSDGGSRVIWRCCRT